MAPTGEHGVDRAEVASLVRLVLLAIVAGALIGVVGGCFRWLLLRIDERRVALVHWAHGAPAVGWLVPVLLVASGACCARWIVRAVPLASGSGVQEVEERWRSDELVQDWTLLPAKFFGGLIAIGSGLALGREGPTVHMGAVIAVLVGKRAHLEREDQRALEAAAAGAGLGVAFNAPAGGAAFVFEEVARSFRLRLTLATFAASATAVAVGRLIVGDVSDFQVASVTKPGAGVLVFYAVFGLATGALGVAYNRLVLRGLDLFARYGRQRPELGAAVVGAGVGLLLWFQPQLGGGGAALSQRVLGGGIGVATLAAYLGIRFLVGPISYSVGAPGGLFAPLLVVGALWGGVAHGLVHAWLPGVGSGSALAIVGMATFFTAVVRAPFTGLLLIVEMTGVSSVLVPMLAASAGALLMTTVLHSKPIYDSLRDRLEQAETG